MRHGIGRFRAGGDGLTRVTSPANQSILTNGAANTVSANKISSFTADGVNIGSGSSSVSWTPGALDFDVDLIATANGVASTAIKVAVAEANHMGDFPTWGPSLASTPVSGYADPFGGTTACQVTMTASAGSHSISKAGSPVSAAANGGFEFWIQAGSGIGAVQIRPGDDSGLHHVYVDLATGHTQSNLAYAKVVETRGSWKRIWFGMAQGMVCNNVFLFFCPSIGTTSWTPTSGDFVRLCAPRLADGALPFTNYQRASVRYVDTTGNIDRWAYRSPYIDTIADEVTFGDRYIYVLKPTSYGTAGPLPVVYVGEVEPTRATSFGDSLGVIQTLGLHNTYNCLFVSTNYKSMPWYGVKNDGTIDAEKQFRDVLVGLVEEFYSVRAERNSRLLLGFSKSGFGALSMLLRNPTIFGYAACWDTPWNLVYGDFETVASFGTSGQFDLYNPKGILTSYLGSVNDKRRIVLGGSALFDADTVAFDTFLTSNSISHAYLRTVLTSGDHSWNNLWVGAMVAALMALRT